MNRPGIRLCAPTNQQFDFADLNRQARAWCDKANAKFRRALHASSVELFAAERPALRPLPVLVDRTVIYDIKEAMGIRPRRSEILPSFSSIE